MTRFMTQFMTRGALALLAGLAACTNLGDESSAT